MTCTVKELMEEYNLDTSNVRQKVLDFELPVGLDEHGVYSKEIHNGKEVHVFTGQDKVPDSEYELKVEYILDLNEPESWTEIREWIGSNERAFYNIIQFPDEEYGLTVESY